MCVCVRVMCIAEQETDFIVWFAQSVAGAALILLFVSVFNNLWSSFSVTIPSEVFGCFFFFFFFFWGGGGVSGR